MKFTYAITSHNGKIEYANGEVEADSHVQAMSKIATYYETGEMAIIPKRGGALSLKVTMEGEQ